MTNLAQFRAIHALRRQIGLTDDEYRGLLEKQHGKSSSKDLSEAQAGSFIDILKQLAGQKPGVSFPARRASQTASGPYAGVLRALWIAAYNLGLARSRDDAAMMAFVERQTKLKHTRFLQDHGDATKAIEGLKAWLARDGGVAWPTRAGGQSPKQAICEAVAKKAQDWGAFTPMVPGRNIWPADVENYGRQSGLPVSFEAYAPADFDTLANRLGARLRTHIAKLATRKKDKAA